MLDLNITRWAPFWCAVRQWRQGAITRVELVLAQLAYAGLLLVLAVRPSQHTLADFVIGCLLIALSMEFLDEIARRSVRAKRCFFAALGLLFGVTLVLQALAPRWEVALAAVGVLAFFVARLLRLWRAG